MEYKRREVPDCEKGPNDTGKAMFTFNVPYVESFEGVVNANLRLAKKTVRKPCVCVRVHVCGYEFSLKRTESFW